MKKYSKQCPVCKSVNITWYAGGVTGNYECKGCGYVGILVLEVVEDDKRQRQLKGG